MASRPAERPENGSRGGERTLYWVEGLHPSGMWHPLYCYRSPEMARAVFRHIIDLPEEQLPSELEGYEDFRAPQLVRSEEG